ncbi:hypothetical protein [Bifidobacterium thermophilum]|uniref:hypothetical protein n=1 Tax=Bifidobacterium thermophilum TaxID=33905 RepID=UPI0030B39A26
MALQGFKEVTIRKIAGKPSMTVTKTIVRFNKATVAYLEYPEFVKIYVNPETRQVAIEPCTGHDRNAVKFCKPGKKNILSVSIRDLSVVDAVTGFFTFEDVDEDHVAYHTVPGEKDDANKAAVFDLDQSTAGVMKRRGRKKTIATAK